MSLSYSEQEEIVSLLLGNKQGLWINVYIEFKSYETFFFFLKAQH